MLLTDYWWRSIDEGCHFSLLKIFRINVCSIVRQATKQNSGISLKLHKPNFHSGRAISVLLNIKGKKVDWSVGLDGVWGVEDQRTDFVLHIFQHNQNVFILHIIGSHTLCPYAGSLNLLLCLLLDIYLKTAGLRGKKLPHNEYAIYTFLVHAAMEQSILS